MLVLLLIPIFLELQRNVSFFTCSISASEKKNQE